MHFTSGCVQFGPDSRHSVFYIHNLYQTRWSANQSVRYIAFVINTTCSLSLAHVAVKPYCFHEKGDILLVSIARVLVHFSDI